MGRGFRGRGNGGRRGGGGGQRGGRGGRGFKRGTANLDNKDVRHIRDFGEEHPSCDFGPSSSKRPRISKSDRFQPRRRGRGGSNYYNNSSERRFPSGQDEDGSDSASGESDNEEVTPYKELLALFSKKKGTAAAEVQILSDEDEDDEEEDEVQDQNLEEDDSTDKEKLGEGQNSGDDDAVEDNDDNEEGGDSSDDGDDDVDDNENNYEELDDEETSVKGPPPPKRNEAKDLETVDEDNDANAEESVIEESELNPDMEDENSEQIRDPFLLHFEREMPPTLLSSLKAENLLKTQTPFSWPVIDKFNFVSLNSKEINEQVLKEENLHQTTIDLSAVGRAKPILLPNPPTSPPSQSSSWEDFGIKTQFGNTFPLVNQKVVDTNLCRGILTPLQSEFLHLTSQYFDTYLPTRTLENAEALRNIYCLHAANHILKTRTRILHHNAKMTGRVDVPDAYRDQGFVRPKVLILVPFKDSALKIVNTLVSLFLEEEKGNVANKKRFVEDYGGTTLFLPKTNPKPDDYNATFSGNVEDNFKIGLSLTKKTVKLYTAFYSSDIIVASPLGLRLIVGAEGEKGRDYDFLSSIELLIMDQADVFLMQNWDHILHILKHLNLQPTTTHGTDFARIRPWALDGLTKYFRQTILISSLFCPEHSAVMTRYCQNYSGQIRVSKYFQRGSIADVTVQLPQVFQYFESSSLQKVDDDRFDFFVKSVLPNFTEKLMSHTMIFVSSYFDFVRLRNHFKREQSTFVQICEYTKDKKIARARDYFFHGQGHFLLYTERVHFFRRFRLKGVGHILFYQLPQNPQFYSELCNSIREDFQNRKVRQRKNASVNVMYSKYDTPRLAPIVGSERASHMLSSDKNVHAFVSSDS